MKQSYRDLQVFQLAMDLTELIYLVTALFPKHELYGLTSQMRRAAVSIPSNVAEGSARSSRKDFRHFVLMAKGSTCELQVQLSIAGRLKYLTDPDLHRCEALANRIARMLSGLAESLKAVSKTPPQTPESIS